VVNEINNAYVLCFIDVTFVDGNINIVVKDFEGFISIFFGELDTKANELIEFKVILHEQIIYVTTCQIKHFHIVINFWKFKLN